jgi:hypothetical protein
MNVPAIRLLRDLTDVAKYPWIKDDFLKEGRIVYHPDNKIKEQMKRPKLRRISSFKEVDLMPVALDQPGSQSIKRTEWIPVGATEAVRVNITPIVENKE